MHFVNVKSRMFIVKLKIPVLELHASCREGVNLSLIV